MQSAIIYLRVSTEEQAERGFSIQAQKEECIKKANELGCIAENIIIFSDEGVSGAILERPQLMAALELLKKKGCNYFICNDTSRLSRNVSHQLMIVDEIKKCGAELVFLKNQYQDNPDGRFQITIMAAVDEYERARLRLRIEMGKRAKAKQHRLTHNPGIYGYDFDIKTDCLNINEDQATIVKLMYRWLTEEDMGPSEISETLNEIGVPSPRKKLWNRVTVRRILSNESYTGVLYIRRYDTRDYHLNKFKKSSEKIRVKERPKYEWIPVSIPEIIKKELWLKAQDILKKSARAIRRESSKAEFLLSAVLKCGECGSCLCGKHVCSGKREYNYYICSAKNKKAAGRSCTLKLIKGDKLEIEIWRVIEDYVLNHPKLELDVTAAVDNIDRIIEDNIKLLQRELEKSKEESGRIITLFRKGFIEEDEMSEKVNKLRNKALMLESAIENKRTTAKKNFDDIRKIIKTKNIYNNIEAMLKKMDKQGKKHIINELISEIIVDKDSFLIRGRF